MLAAIAALTALTGFAPPESRVDYVLTPLFDHGALKAVQVDLMFLGERGGRTLLNLPNSWGGQTELYHAIHSLRAISNVAIGDGADAAHRVLSYRPHSFVHVQYVVFQDWVGEPRAENGNPYRPIVQPRYFHLIGETFLAIPQLNDDTPAYVHVRDLPQTWRFASDLEHRGLTLGTASASVAVAGDYRVVRGADPNIRVALRGQWSFTDAEFAQRVNAIIAGERAFWGDRPTQYLVTVTQLTMPSTGWLSIGGTGLEDSFAFFATSNADLHQMTRTLAHEGIHTWIPAQVGRMPEHDEASDYWFSEGFTDFYTGRILVREGIWTPAEYAADFNEMLSAYAQSSVRTQPNTRIVADFWNNQEVEKLPYQRGRMLATIWDARLRERGHSIDEVMQTMRARARHADHPQAVSSFASIMSEMGVDVRADIATYVEQGAPVTLPENLFTPCGRVATRTAPVFSRGFDIEATTANHNVISGVDPALPAYAAGLRDGMVLVRRDHGTIGDSEHEIAYVVRDGETERTFTYMPRGHGAYTLQALVLDEHLAGDQLARCQAVLAGR